MCGHALFSAHINTPAQTGLQPQTLEERGTAA
jgi:hypothetical protein